MSVGKNHTVSGFHIQVAAERGVKILGRTARAASGARESGGQRGSWHPRSRREGSRVKPPAAAIDKHRGIACPAGEARGGSGGRAGDSETGLRRLGSRATGGRSAVCPAREDSGPTRPVRCSGRIPAPSDRGNAPGRCPTARPRSPIQFPGATAGRRGIRRWPSALAGAIDGRRASANKECATIRASSFWFSGL